MFKVEKAGTFKEEQQTRIKWPFSELEIGDSALIEDETLFSKAQQYAHAYGYQSGRKFRTSRGPSGMRIVRIA